MTGEEAEGSTAKVVGKLLLVIGGLAGVVAIPIAILIVVFALALSSISIGPCDYGGTDRTDCAGSTNALVRASVERGDVAVKRLLDAGAKPNATDKPGNRALPCAAMVGNEPAVVALLEGGASATASGYTGGRPIVAAVSGEGRVGNEPAQDETGTYFAPLDDDARVAIVQVLVLHGASPTDALSPAAEKGLVPVVRALLRAGADPAGDPTGPSPLVSAVYADNRPIARLLIERGADVDAGGVVPSGQAFIAVMAAASSRAQAGDPPLTEPAGLPEAGNVPPVVAAVVRGRLVAGEGLLTDLIRAKADPDAPAFDRFTALWVAVVLHDTSAALVLRGAGADVEPPGLESPLALARANRDEKMLEILLA